MNVRAVHWEREPRATNTLSKPKLSAHKRWTSWHGTAPNEYPFGLERTLAVRQSAKGQNVNVGTKVSRYCDREMKPTHDDIFPYEKRYSLDY